MSAPRLSAEAKNGIAAAYAAGERLDRIAAKFGVDPSYPTHLAKRRGIPLRARMPAKGSPSILWVLRRARRRASEIQIEVRAARVSERETKLRQALAALDEKSQACFDRCRTDGLSIAKSLSLAQEDQNIRARRAGG